MAKITDDQITEAEIELTCEIAIQVLDFLKTQKESMVHEAIMRRIEQAMKRKSEPKKEMGEHLGGR